MSFVDSDRESIRKYLGFPPTQPFRNQIAQRCLELEQMGDEVVATVRSLIRELVKIDREISDARPFASQSFQSSAGGTRQYFPGERLNSLKGEGRRLVMELSATLQLHVHRDIYGGAGGWNTAPVRRG